MLRLDLLRWRALCFAALVAGCSADEAAPTQAPPPPPSVVERAFVTAETTLPEGMTGEVHVATGAGRTALAGERGLFALGADRFEAVDPRPVRALAHVDGIGFVVVTDDAISIWDGAVVRPSTLMDSVQPRDVRALAGRGAALFVVTADRVLVLEDGRLTALAGLGSVTDVAAFQSGPLVVRRERGGALLERRDGAWHAQEVEEELGWLVPAEGGRVLGVRAMGRVLVERTTAAGVASFRALSLSPRAGAPPTGDIDALYTDPTTGAVWAAHGGSLSVIGQGVVATGARPAALAPGARAWATADGGLAVVSGGRLVRITGGPERISWQEAVRPIYLVHCERCHRDGGVARFPLATAEDWRRGAAAITSSIEAGRMPRDRATTVSPGELEVVRRWQGAGLD